MNFLSKFDSLSTANSNSFAIAQSNRVQGRPDTDVVAAVRPRKAAIDHPDTSTRAAVPVAAHKRAHMLNSVVIKTVIAEYIGAI